MRPPTRLLQFRSTHADHVREFITREFGDHSRVFERRGPMEYSLTAGVDEGVVAGWSTSTSTSTLRAAVLAPTVHLPMSGQITYRVGRRVLEVAPGRAILLQADHDYTNRSTPGVMFGIRLDAGRLLEALDARGTFRLRYRAMQSLPLALSPVGACELGASITAFIGQVRAVVDGSLEKKEALQATTRRLVAWFAHALLDQQGLRAVAPATLTLAEDLDDWIACHLDVDLTLGQLEAAMGVSGRTLQKASMLRWGQSPMELLGSRRLAAARRRLEHGPTAGSVTRVAIACGFTHLSRFAQDYRRAFGELPSETRARVAPLHGGASVQPAATDASLRRRRVRFPDSPIPRFSVESSFSRRGSS